MSDVSRDLLSRIELLFNAVNMTAPFPEGVVGMPGRIRGTAFFPGGFGVWDIDGGASPIGRPSIMILGHDFHSETGYRKSFDRGGEVTIKDGRLVMGPTWHGLVQLLKSAHVDPAQCFFTNAYMGLREGDGTTGRFPGSTDPAFVDRCRTFLALQIQTMRPSAILTLGAWVPSFIAPLSPELKSWSKARALVDVDKIGPIIPNAHFPDATNLVCAVGALTHPSLRGPNVGRRCYDGVRGHTAELHLIRDVLLHAQIPNTD
jgi:hypothetical protein